MVSLTKKQIFDLKFKWGVEKGNFESPLFQKLFFIDVAYKAILSEEFIRDFKDQLDWDGISRYQQLSEDFIEEMKNYVNWQIIINSQKLSTALYEKMKKEGYINENINKASNI